ncbi:hypothetical protein HNR27_000615 [Ornithinibacillus bavariensis]
MKYTQRGCDKSKNPIIIIFQQMDALVLQQGLS